MHWKVPLYAALACAVLVLLPGGMAQVPEKPQPCAGDLVLGDTDSNGADDALELHVAGVQNPGTWAGFTTFTPTDWLASQRGVPVFAFGPCQKASQWAFRTFESGENVEYHYGGTNPPTGGGDGLNGYRTSGPTMTLVAGSPAAAVTVYDIENGKDRFRIVTTLSLHGTTRLDTVVHMGYEVCNKNPGTAQFGLKNFVAAQTGPDAGIILGNTLDEYGAVQEVAWSDNETRYTDFTTDAGHHMATTTAGAAMHLVALLRDHDGFTPPVHQGEPLTPTTPTDYFFWAEDDLQPEFDPPTGGGQLEDGGIAWFWGTGPESAMVVGGVGTPTECWEGHAYVAVDAASVVPDRDPPVNSPPVAVLDADTSNVSCMDSAVRFSAWDSLDVDSGKPTRLAWTFGDGSKWPETGSFVLFTDPNVNRTKVYHEPGSHTVVLQVWDAQLATHIVQRTIEVVGDPNCPPVIGPSGVPEVEPGSRIEITANVTDTEGDRLRFTLKGAPSFLDVHPRTGLITGLVPSESALYAFELCVTDDWPGNEPACTPFEISVGDPPPPGTSSDQDGDGVADDSDNCYLMANRNQADRDKDGVGDLCDAADPAQEIPRGPGDPQESQVRCDVALDGDMDGDGLADPCDLDIDGDGILERTTRFLDNCPFVTNPGQQDSDGDGIGDACDGTDGFGYANLAQKGLPCTGCPDAETFGEAPTRVEGRGFGLMGLGLVVGFGLAGAAVAVLLFGRRG